MRTSSGPAASLLLGALLLTACGTQQPAGAGHVPASAVRCALSADPAGAAADGVEITGVSGGPAGCGAQTPPRNVTVSFRVTNREAASLTYTVRFDVVSASGQVLTSADRTVTDVGPGRSVRATADTGEVVRPGSGAHVRIGRVRSVPAGELPVTSGACPPSGVRVHADQGDAAMGLRVVGLHLQNCSARPYRLAGFPQIQLLDLRHRPVAGVRVLHGSGGISTGTDLDEPPHPMTLRPGERASAGLMWRNTVTEGAAVDVPYVRVIAQPGTHAVTVTPELDLGTTGKLGVGPWKKDAR
jgi:predicted small secreted protein